MPLICHIWHTISNLFNFCFFFYGISYQVFFSDTMEFSEYKEQIWMVEVSPLFEGWYFRFQEFFLKEENSFYNPGMMIYR